RVPAAAGNGKARLTLSYPAWKDGNVTPATLLVPIVETKPKSDHRDRFGSGLENERRVVARIRELGGQIEMEDDAVIGVRLQGPKVTDAKLKRLGDLMDLQSLELKECAITDAGLEYLQDSISLKRLCITAAPISDAGLARLTGLTRLQSLDISGTKVTAEGVKQFKKALPNLKVVR